MKHMLHFMLLFSFVSCTNDMAIKPSDQKINVLKVVKQDFELYETTVFLPSGYGWTIIWTIEAWPVDCIFHVKQT